MELEEDDLLEREDENLIVAQTQNVVSDASPTTGLLRQKLSDVLADDSIQSQSATVARNKVATDLETATVLTDEQKVRNEEIALDNAISRLRLKHKEAEETRRHKYLMAQLKADGEHEAMLDRRKKMEEKYGYLYKQDANGKPIDFSYSKVVNSLRTLARNFDRLDKPFKTFIKILIFGGLIVGAIALLKYFNIF